MRSIVESFVATTGSTLTFRQQVILLGALGLLGVIVAAFLMATSITARGARTAIVHQLQHLSPNYEVRLNGRVIENGAPILKSIRRVTTAWGHHSHPTKPIVIEVTDGERRLKIIIAKDSAAPDEYWIYRPGSNIENDPLGQYIGRVLDPQLTAQLATLE